MTLWMIYRSVNNDFMNDRRGYVRKYKAIGKEKSKKLIIQASMEFELVISAIPVQCSFKLSYEAMNNWESSSFLSVNQSLRLCLYRRLNSTVGGSTYNDPVRAVHRYRQSHRFEFLLKPERFFSILICNSFSCIHN